MKRTIQELSNYKELLDSLLSTLRSADQPEIDKVMNLIQNDRSLQELACAVGCSATTFEDAGTLSATSHLAISEDGDHPMEMNTGQLNTKAVSASDTEVTSPDEAHPKEGSQTGPSPYARISLENLCDNPPFTVPARPWTEVTDDEALVSHLVSLYFTWDHPCAQFVDQTIFLEHMKLQDPSSEFCTPLLVNSLLSMASV